MTLCFQRVGDQSLKSRCHVACAKFVANEANDGAGFGDHRWRQGFYFCNARNTAGIHQVAAAGLQNLLALFFGWNGQLKHHIKAADEGGIQTMDGIGQPQRWHRVFFQHAIHPGLAHLCCAFAPAKNILIVEDIFRLVKHHQRLALSKKALHRAKGAQAALAVDRVAFRVFAGNFEQLVTQLFCQHAGQLALSGSRYAMHKNIDAALPRCRCMTKIGQQNVQCCLNMVVIRQAQLRRRCNRYGASQ